MGVTRVGQAECSLSTLGSFALRIRGRDVQPPSTQKARALLTYLILKRHSDVSRERLVDVFWPDAAPERARDSLNTATHSIRRCLRNAQLDPDEFLFANKSIERWETDVDIDIELLEKTLREERADDQVALLRYQGEFLEGDYDDWTVAQRERSAALYEQLLSRAVRTTKEPEIAKRLLARNPYDEEAYVTLIDAELSAGRYLSATQIIEQCRAALKEIGAKPSEQFTARFKDAGTVRAPLSTRIDLPFVGRDAEFAELLELVEHSAGDIPRIGVIEGDPGIGKSAFVEQLVEEVAGRGIRAVTVRGVCDDPRAFGSWTLLYSALSGKAFDEVLQAAQGSIASELASAIVASLPARCVLVLDDAQYLSGDALDTMAAIAKQTSGSESQTFVISTRPEGLRSIAERLGDIAFSLCRLMPLNDEEVDTAMALASVCLDVETAELVRARAQGHPLYLLGLLNQLARSGALCREGNRWVLVRGESELHLPTSLRRLIENRIRSRGEEAVAVAAALAMEPALNTDELAEVTGLNRLQVLDALDDLLGYHIIVESTAGPHQFSFSHDLVEEGARTLLPAARRIALHEELARALSSSNVLGRDARRASHLAAAAHYHDATIAYLSAAQEAIEARAPQAALERCAAAMYCLDRLVESPDLNLLRSRACQLRFTAHRLLWQLDETASSAREAVDYARASGDLRCLAQALTSLRHSFTLAEETDAEAVVPVVREIGSIARQLDDNALLVQSLIDEGMAYRLAFLVDRALPCLEQALSVARASGDDKLIVKASLQLLLLQTMWWRFRDVHEIHKSLDWSCRNVGWDYRLHVALAWVLLWLEVDRYRDVDAELRTLHNSMRDATSKRSMVTVPLSELAIRLDYFQPVVDGRRGAWDAALRQFGQYESLYAPLLQEARYRDLFDCTRIDLLLGRANSGDVDVACDLAKRIGTDWIPETGFQPYHAPAVIRARLHARLRLADARPLLEDALRLLDHEATRLPYGIDEAYAKVAASAADASCDDLASRASARFEEYHSRRIAAAGELWGNRT